MLRTLKYGQAEQASHLTITYLIQNSSKIFGFLLFSIFCTFPSKILLLFLLYSLVLFFLSRNLFSELMSSRITCKSNIFLQVSNSATNIRKLHLCLEICNTLRWMLWMYLKKQFPKLNIAKWSVSFLIQNLLFISNKLDPRYSSHYLYFFTCSSSILPHNQHPVKSNIFLKINTIHLWTEDKIHSM